jgi:hypothetical protein
VARRSSTWRTRRFRTRRLTVGPVVVLTGAVTRGV